jgi:hypothetical protein
VYGVRSVVYEICAATSRHMVIEGRLEKPLCYLDLMIEHEKREEKVREVKSR